MKRTTKTFAIFLALLMVFSVFSTTVTISASASSIFGNSSDDINFIERLFQAIGDFFTSIINAINGACTTPKEPEDKIVVPDEADVVIEEDADIQEVFDEAEEDAVIFFMPGEYDFSDIELDKPLTLLGPNHDIPAYSPDRHEEAKIITDTIKNLNTVGDADAGDAMFTISTSDVNISGFLIDGNNPDADGEFNLNTGILFYGEGSKTEPQGDLDNIVIKNNIIQNTFYAGIDLGGQYTNPQSTLIEISGNYIKNIWNSNESGYGMGISITYDAYAIIKDNVIEGVRQGIQTNNCVDKGTHYTGTERPTIENNTIITKKVGIWINQNDSSIGWDIINNTIKVDADATDPSYGISFTSGVSPNGTYEVRGNKIDGFLAGIHMWHGKQPGVVVYGGEISNCDMGIAISSKHAAYGNGGTAANRACVITVAEKPIFTNVNNNYVIENYLATLAPYNFIATYDGFSPSHVNILGTGKADINGIPQNYTP